MVMETPWQRRVGQAFVAKMLARHFWRDHYCTVNFTVKAVQNQRARALCDQLRTIHPKATCDAAKVHFTGFSIVATALLLWTY